MESKQARDNLRLLGSLCQRRDASKFARLRRDFYGYALSLLDSNDDSIIQETAAMLASDGGLPFIRESADSLSNGNSLELPGHDTMSEIGNMVKILSHPRINESAVLEEKMATMHTFFAGPSGRRMAAIFDFMLAELAKKWDLSLAESCLLTLAKVIDNCTANVVDEHLRGIVASFDQLFSSNTGEADSFSQFQSLRALAYLKRRLKVGDAIPKAETVAASSNRATFALTRDMPGELSKDGPRHDNDHQDISKIKILPTMSEILSPRDDYLPTTDPSQGHLSGIEWLIDRHFRLLRKDTVGQLTNAVHAELSRIKNTASLATKSKNAARTLAYSDAQIEDIRFHNVKGLELVISFPQPAAVRKMNLKKREEWWQTSKRLQPGALVCMLNPYGQGTVLFCLVAENDAKGAKQAQASKERDGQQNGQAKGEGTPSFLWDDKDRAVLLLSLVEPDSHNIGRAIRWFRNTGQGRGQVLVEFPGVLLASFHSTLETLQSMSRSPNLPFVDVLAPSSASNAITVHPPHYSQKPGFTFDLSCIATTQEQLRFTPANPFDVHTLEKNTSLDESQATAVLNSLRQSLALIEGPPGTGKSFTGEVLVKVLLANKANARLGPILVVCYTNHALDQMLEHLYRAGIIRIIRIGSRSKSEVLEKLNLRFIARGAEKTRSEGAILYKARTDIESLKASIDRLLAQLRDCGSTSALKAFLERESPRHFRELFRGHVDEDGFMKVSRKTKQYLQSWLRGGSRTVSYVRTPEELQAANIFTLTNRERAALHDHWLKTMRDEITGELLSAHKSWLNAKAQMDRVHREVDARCLAEADVIGVTTTGLARNVELLRRVKSKVLLCEEAGEVLEAHLLTALLPSIEHAILIGDHLQLRPQIQNYDLQSTHLSGQKYSLDVSLFERLVNPFMDNDPKVPYSILHTQRRMHPSISRLIREPLYPGLEDAESVRMHPPVAGMRKRLFWLHHEHEEQGKDSGDPTSTSISNEWEAHMTVALVTHLIRQGKYSDGNIAVVVPYLKQLRILRNLFGSQFEIVLNDRDTNDLEDAAKIDSDGGEAAAGSPSRAGKTSLLKAVRLATVDNFQGEEAKVVVISLVRSNAENRPGFLRISNRINVLLSRARHGMYIIGNANTAGTVDMWAQVLAILKSEGNFGTCLELECPRHPETPLLVSEPDHIALFAPDGGCQRPCEKRLECGHRCHGRCHSDLLHGVFKCLEPCARAKKGCDHPCPRECGQPCEEQCSAQVDGLDITLACGHHVSTALCWQAQNPEKIVCKVKTMKNVPDCEHTVMVPCDVDVATPTFKCPAICADKLPCGDTCERTCSFCRKKTDGTVTVVEHGRCQRVCGRNYTTCKHSCREKCHEGNCKPCNAACIARCSHSVCGKKCHEPCAVCAEMDCASRCPHSQCSMPCAAPCDWIPCSKRCEKKLECGHQCPSFCGEMCPARSFCQKCGSDKVLTSIADLLEMKEYRDIDLDEEPCLFLLCGHVFTAATLDGQMELSRHYSLSPQGHPDAILSHSNPFSVEQVKVCPHCRGSLRNIARYGRIIRRALLDETTKKFVVWSNTEFAELWSRFVSIKTSVDSLPTDGVYKTIGRAGVLKVSGDRGKLIEAICDWVGESFLHGMKTYREQVDSHAQRVRREEQPFQRVADFVAHARRQRKTSGHFAFDESLIQLKGELQARALLLRCDMFILCKFMELRQGAKECKTEFSLDLSALKEDCASLVKVAQDSVHPKEMVEGSIFLAQCHALERSILNDTTDQTTKERCISLKGAAEEALEQAKAVMVRFPDSTAALQAEVDNTVAMLRDQVFYQRVSEDETRAIFKAMGFATGHWYTCANGHPFAIGECGMPMEEAACPECGARIGGRDHQAVAGVERAHEIEAIGTGIRALQLI